ncbi:MAG: hypothetical protein KF745_11705 [Phycisphaeraceae bacterium]|nr:hypothetical protein [Phycisphaeraceae bacterium]
MNIRTLLRYLVGSREAIMEIASTRWSLAVGAMFVLSASLARNYDGAYLPAEWTVLLHGLAASIGNSLVLFGFVWLVVRLWKGQVPGFLHGYLCFLGLFWMTAPMAWLYAVPYERFLTPVQAIKANAWTLAFVSLWRVVLMTRVLAVLFAAPPFLVLCLMLPLADAIVLAAAVYMPAPLVDIMGGMQHTPEDGLLASLNVWVQVVAVYSGPVWIIAGIIGVSSLRGSWQEPPRRVAAAPRGLLVLGALSIIAWAPALAVTQPEQGRRYLVESLLCGGRVAEGLAALSASRRTDFPPVWDIPPRIGFAEPAPGLLEVQAAMSASQPAAWVREIYVHKAWRAAMRYATLQPVDDNIDRNIEFLCKSPYLPQATFPRAGLSFIIAHDDRLSAEQRGLLIALEASLPAESYDE